MRTFHARRKGARIVIGGAKIGVSSTIFHRDCDRGSAKGITGWPVLEGSGGFRGGVCDYRIGNQYRVIAAGCYSQWLRVIATGTDTCQVNCLQQGILVDRDVRDGVERGRGVDRVDRDVKGTTE